MKIVLASGNRHKKKEIERILTSHTVLLPEESGVSFSFEETGVTFLENAMGKARHLYEITGDAVLADDSGLCVPALGGAPGVFSARYGTEELGGNLTDSDRNGYLLENMKEISDRRAFFVCSMVLLINENRFFVAQETVHGEITLSPQGIGGFGYDPLFFLPEYGKTAAQLTAEKKNEISHRGRAVAAIGQLIASVEIE